MANTILFIDDEMEPLFYHCKTLEGAGYVVQSYHSAEESICFLTGIRTAADLPALIILDIYMPNNGRFANNPDNPEGMRTGFCLFKELCMILRNNGLDLPPLIFLTQLRNPAILEEAIDLVTDAFVLDKFTTGPTALLEKVNRILGGS